jgi:hypothetical protein
MAASQRLAIAPSNDSPDMKRQYSQLIAHDKNASMNCEHENKIPCGEH